MIMADASKYEIEREYFMLHSTYPTATIHFVMLQININKINAGMQTVSVLSFDAAAQQRSSFQACHLI